MVDLKSWFPFRFPPHRDKSERTPAARMPQALTTLRDEMDRMFERFWTNPLASIEQADRWFGDFRSPEFLPKLDVTDDAAVLKVSLEVPGMDGKDVDVQVHEGLLVVSGEKRAEETRQDEGCYRTERSYGAWKRTVPLPAEVDAAKAEARVEKGVLTIVLPKTAAAKQRPVKVAVKT